MWSSVKTQNQKEENRNPDTPESTLNSPKALEILALAFLPANNKENEAQTKYFEAAL
jgi:hypothetical protein